MTDKKRTPILDKFNLHPCGGHCTCFSQPFTACASCKAVLANVQRWKDLSPENRKRAKAEMNEAYPCTSNQDGR
jgi:predicted Fe-S protein YdhL (DUF1289 family)